MFRSRTSFLSRLALLLSLCVLATRMAIPGACLWEDGARGCLQMFGQAGSGSMSMPMAMHASDPHDQGKHSHKGAADHPCPFGAAHAPLDVAALSDTLALPAAHADAATLLYLHARPGLGLAAPPPPKTGPPAFT